MLSANETPAADATAASTVVAAAATTAAATPCFQTGSRWPVRVDASGVRPVGTSAVVDMSSSVSSAVAWCDRLRPTPRTGGDGSDRSQEEMLSLVDVR